MTLATAGGNNHNAVENGRALVEFTGDPNEISADDSLLVERLKEPLRRALRDTRANVRVRIESRGRVGEILIRISGSRACLRLSFGRDEAEPGYVSGVVRDALARFAL